MRTFAIIVLSLVYASTLAGCKDQVYGMGLVPQSVKGDEHHVRVFNVWKASDAQPLADRWCLKHNKKAVFSRSAPITMIFDCV